MKNIIRHLYVLCLISFFLTLVGCVYNSSSQGYDGRVYDISANQDNSLVAKTIKSGKNSYSLSITGTGDSITFNTKETVPWNAISKRIDTVTLYDGITSLSSYLFYNIELDYIYIPSTVKKIEKDAFNSKTKLYSYSSNINSNVTNKIYYYSATKPTSEGDYFYILDDEPVIWKIYKFLFIGNSFTYCPELGSDTNPYIPNLFKSIADDLGIDTVVDYVTKGSYTLTRFASKDDELGKVVDEKLHNNQYDFIVLQEHSTTPINNYQTFYNAVFSFVSKVEELQNNAEIRLYETWGFPNSSGTRDVVEMTDNLITAYNNCANGLGLKVNEVGKGFNVITKEHKELNLYIGDNKHTSNVGAYLSALIHVGSMLNIDIRNTRINGGLDNYTANLLKEIAYNIVFNNK